MEEGKGEGEGKVEGEGYRTIRRIGIRTILIYLREQNFDFSK